MHLLCEFKKPYKTRKDKGKKRISNTTSERTKNNYLKARTFRNITSPFIDTAREVRHWTALGLRMKPNKTKQSNTKSIRQKLGVVRDIKGLLK